MLDLNHYLDVTADGSTVDWAVMYADSSWEAVTRSSADTAFIQSATLNQETYVTCGDGGAPQQGVVSAVTVHYRIRTTDSVGSPEATVYLTRSGAILGTGKVIAVDPAPSGGWDPTEGGGGLPGGGAVEVEELGTGWADGEFRINIDTDARSRFPASGLGDLGCAVKVSTAPTEGYMQVARLWIEIEWARSSASYDPGTFAIATTPDAIVGELTWNTTGTQTASVPISKEYLEIQDSSNSDWRAYDRTFPEFTDRYVTEIATRFTITSITDTTDAFVYRAAQIDDATAMVDVCCFYDSNGDKRIGFITGSADRNDQAAYIDSAILDWTDDHHYRLIVDRDTDMDLSNHVKLFVDYSETATLEGFYEEFDGTGGSGVLAFGTGDATYPESQLDVEIIFIDWYSYAKAATWRHWDPLAEGDNVVTANQDDEFIQRPVFVTPPGIWTSGSDRCCQLQVQDLTKECSVGTFFTPPSATDTYDLAVDYRVDTLATDAKLVVQRASDFYYWNNGGSAWQAAASDVTLAYSPGRTRLAAMSAITTTLGEQLILKVRNDTGAAAAHNVFVYKVGLTVT